MQKCSRFVNIWLHTNGLGALACLWKTPIAFVMPACLSVSLSVCPYVSERLSLDGFSWNFILETYMKIFWKNLFLVAIGKNIGHICALLGYYAASNGNPSPTFRDNVSVPSSRVKKSQKSADLISIAAKALNHKYWALYMKPYLILLLPATINRHKSELFE
jgi:hypothetical protein